MKCILIILDGFGLNPVIKGNPVMNTPLPFLDEIFLNSPRINLSASAESVGLSWGEVGNSEVGHSNIGTGQIIWQDLPKINQSIESGAFFKNKVINNALESSLKNNSSLHLVGLLSDGGVHSDISHLFALLEMAKKRNLAEVYVHVFTDGRDTPPKVAEKFIKELENKMKDLGIGKISTISGRFYAMDRDDHWERIEKVYNAMIGTSNRTSKDAQSALKMGYREGQNDENIEPTIVSLGTGKQFLKNKDSIIIFNFRADRARQITLSIGAFVFKHFKREKVAKDIYFATMTPYETDWKIEIHTIFGLLHYESPLADIIGTKNLKQLHMAETEKYAHVTYFFNGGREKRIKNEKYINIPSPRVESYAEKPEMSLHQVTSEFLGELGKNGYDFVVVNFANPDMVGHTGNYKAAQKALSAMDENLAYIIPDAQKKGYKIFLTADHGNIEQMINLETGEIDKEHTTNPVPFVLISENLTATKIQPKEHQDLWERLATENTKGVLADITPTIGETLGIENVPYFSGQSMLTVLK
jgi:2,3-bisphosphoglycerate-independent phosphoglycerate mutase